MRAGEDAGLLLVLLAVQFGLQGRGTAVRGDVGGLLGGRDHVHQRVLRRQHHVGRAEQRVGAGREDLDLLVADREAHAGAVAAPDPVALHGLDLLRPVQPVQVVDQPVGVRGDPHHPLAQVPPEHGEVAALAAAVGGDLLVGQHRAQAGAPVHRRLGQVGQAVLVQHLALLGAGQPGPRAAVRRRPGAVGELRLQLGDRPRLARVGVVPGVEDLQEDPLRPLVVLDVDRGDPAALVVAQPQPADLPQVGGHVVLGGLARVLAGLHRVLLRGQAERVEAHGVQHVPAVHPVVPGEHVGADEAQRVADVQPRARRVREHVLHEQLVRGHRLTGGQRADRVRRVERAVVLPVLLPALLDPTCQLRRVAEGRGLRGRLRAHRTSLSIDFLPLTRRNPPAHQGVRGGRADQLVGQRGWIRSRQALLMLLRYPVDHAGRKGYLPR